jgi:autotransporter translocation and assembly factor TamB
MAVDKRIIRGLKVAGLVLAIIVIVVLTGVAGVIHYARTDGGRERLRNIVLKEAQASIPGLAIGRIGGDFVHDLVLEDVRIRDNQGRDAVKVDRLTARFSLVPLVRGRLFLRELLVERPQVLGRPTESGKLNLTELTAPAKTEQPEASPAEGDKGSPLAIQVDRLSVTGARADVETAAGQSIVLESLDLEGRLAMAGEDIRVEAAPLEASAVVDGHAYRVNLRSKALLSDRSIHAVLDQLVIGGIAPREEDIVVRGQAGGPREAVGFRLEVGLPPDAGSLQAHGRAGVLATGGLGAYAVELRAAEVNPRLLAVNAPKGKLSLTVTARGSGTPLAPDSRAALALSMPTSRLGGLRILEAKIDASAEGQAWRLARLFVRGAGAELMARGEGKGNQVQAHLGASIGDPADGRLPAPDFRGKGVLTADLRGSLPDDLVLEASAKAHKLAIGEARIGALALKVNGKADKTDRTVSLAARAQVDRIVAGQGKPTVRSATIRANIDGPVASPRGQLRLVARRVKPGGDIPPMDNVILTATSDGKNARLEGALSGAQARGGVAARGVISASHARMTLARFSIDLRGPRLRQTIALQKPVTVRWRANDLVELGETKILARGAKLAGVFQASGMYRLDRRGRQEPRATGALSLRKASVGGLDPMDADAWLKLSRTQLSAGADAKVGGKADIHLSLGVPVVPGPTGGAPQLAKDGPLNVQVKTSQIRIDELPLLSKQLARRGVSGGTVSLVASVAGDVAHPDAKVAFDVRELELRKVSGEGRDSVVRRLPGVGAVIKVDTQRGLIKTAGEAMLHKAGFLKFDSTLKMDLGALLAGADAMKAPVELGLEVPKFQIASLKGYFDQLRDTEGILAGNVELRGTLARPTGKADITISNARVDKVRFGPVALQASSTGDKLTGDVKIHQHQGGSLVARLDLDQRGKPRLAATAAAKKLDVTFVRLFTTGVRELAGVVDADVKLAGTVARPAVQGMVYYYDGRVGLIGQPTFHDVAVTLALKPGRVDIQKLQAYSGGSLTGKGWLTLDGAAPTGMVLTAHANRFLLAAAGSTGARLDGDLAVAAELNDAVLAGKVKVPQASLWLPKVGAGGKKLQKIGQHEDVRFVDQAAKAAEEKKQDEKENKQPDKKQEGGDQLVKQPRKLDVKANAGTVFVRAKDLDIELDSNLSLTGDGTGDPAVNGVVQIRRGRINITGQRFNFEPGEIGFDGGTNPNLNIRITRQYPEALVLVEIRGTPEKPQLRLSSDPPIYDQAQIISLVMTGQPGGQPSTGGAFDPTAAIATAVLGKLADKIAPELGLDVLRVESVKDKSEEGMATGEADTRIEVGKYISERVYLSYAHVFGGTESQNRNEAHVEYRVTRRWLVETVFGDAGVGGVDALWTYRY